MSKSIKKVAFLFGAGAEITPFNLPSGLNYMKACLDYPRLGELTAALKKVFDKKYYGSYSYGGKRTITIDSNVMKNFIHTKALKDVTFVRNHVIELALLLSDDDFKDIISYHSKQTSASPDTTRAIRFIAKKLKDSLLTNSNKGVLTGLKNNLVNDLKNYVKEGSPSPDSSLHHDYMQLIIDLFADKQGPDEKLENYSELEECRKMLERSLSDIQSNKAVLETLFRRSSTPRTYMNNPEFQVGIGNILDSYFHTIIDPTKYGVNNFTKLFNYYWICFFAITEPVVRYLRNSKAIRDGDVSFFLEENSDDTIRDSDGNPLQSVFKLNYETCIRNIQAFIQLIYKPFSNNNDLRNMHSVESTEQSYYELLNSKIQNNAALECCGVATTNYYDFVKQLKPRNNTNESFYAFLNGRLSYLELPEVLEVINLLETKTTDQSRDTKLERQLYMPFLFAPSLIKPIVHQKQIDEFSYFAKMLEESDALIVLGYGINEDDNHINSYLHDYVSSGKGLYVVTGNQGAKEIDSILKKLRIAGEYPIPNVNAIKIDYSAGNEKNVDSILSKIA